MSRAMRLRSECGRYLAERASPDDAWYRLYDRDGVLLGRTDYWSSLITPSRVRFKVGLGPVTAVFGYPRYPKWFRRRWVTCFDIWIDELKALIESFGCEVLVGYKPDWNCWCHVGFRATTEQFRKVDGELTRRGVEWNGPPARSGQWGIECPGRARIVGRGEGRSP